MSLSLELWEDLGTPSTDVYAIEDKVAALVQSSGVRCTTDSNLLDGTWGFAFGSRQSASSLSDINRFDIAAQRQKRQVHPGKLEGPLRNLQRSFFLEDMDEDEDAHVLDTTRYCGGFVRRIQRYNVTRLTRSSLNLLPCEQEWFLCGKRLASRRPRAQSPMDLKLLYVDNDLCVSASDNVETNPFHVYTKSDVWVSRGQRTKRNARRFLNAMKTLGDSVLSIIFLRKRLRTAFKSKLRSDDSYGTRILVSMDDESKQLTVLKLGDLENDANAWDGEDDPFVHLSADERQETLKKMNVRDIVKAGQRQRRRKSRKKTRADTRKLFKKPE